MKVFGFLESASLEVIADPTASVAGRFYLNSTTNNMMIDDGTKKSAVLQNNGRAVFGTDGTLANNVRFHHAGQGLLQFVVGSDTTAENSSSSTLAMVGMRVSNLASAPATGNIGRLYYNTTTQGLAVETANGFLQFATLTGTETLTNKTLTAPSVDILSIVDQGSTPSTPVSGTKLYTKNGSVYKLSSDGLEQAVGSGSGSGAFNYLTNGDFESGVTTAQYATTTLSNGLPSGTGPTVGNTANSITLSSETSAPLRRSQSLKATAATAWAAGHGFSLGPVFTVQPEDLGKILNVTVNYRVVTGGSTLSWAGLPGSQSLQIAIYDLTGAWVATAPGALGFNQSSGTGQVTATFQTSVNVGQQYQVFVINGVASTGPVTVLFDDCSVSPNVANSADQRALTFSGSASGVSVTANQPIALTATIDRAGGWNGSSYVVSIAGDYQINVSGQNNTAASTFLGYLNGNAVPNAYTSFGLQSNNGSAGPMFFPNLKPGDVITIRSLQTGTVSMSMSIIRIGGATAGPDARVIAMHAQMTTSAATTTTGTTMIYDNPFFDTLGAYNKTSGVYTIPVSGIYQVDAAISYNGTGGLINLVKNGTVYERVAQNASAKFQMTGGTSISCVAGDQLSIQGITGSADAVFQAPTLNFLSIKRVTGPTAVAASESVNATVTLSSNLAVGANAVIAFNNKTKDTHNAFANGLFTAPSSGQYRVSALLSTQSGSSYQILKKNNVLVGYFCLATTTLGTGSISVSCSAGDQLGIYCDATGLTFTGASTGLFSQATFERTGN